MRRGASEKDSAKRFGLKQSTIEAINDVMARHPDVEAAILYGSRAKGNYRNGSDIDLTLTGENLTYDSMGRLEIEIDDLLLPYSFDISILSHIDNPDVVDHIHRVGIPFYERDERSPSEGGNGIGSNTVASS